MAKLCVWETLPLYLDHIATCINVRPFHGLSVSPDKFLGISLAYPTLASHPHVSFSTK